MTKILLAIIVLSILLSSGNTMAQTIEDEITNNNGNEETTQGTSEEIMIDPEIEEAFKTEIKVKVLIRIRDTTGIVVSAKDSVEKQTENDMKRKEIFDAKIDAILQLLSENEFEFQRRFISGKAFYGIITKEGFEKIKENSDVVQISKPGISHVTLDESAALINADYAWNLDYTGEDQTICIIDSGIDYTHSDLGGCLGSGCKVLSGWDYWNNDVDPMDDYYHGTHVAGIAASEDGTYTGIAPDANLIALKVCDDDGENCFNEYIADALDFCYFNRNIYDISVVSISLGDGEEYSESECTSTSVNDASQNIEDLYNVGIPVVVSAGNDAHRSGISYPACAPYAISVGAIYDEDVGSISYCTDTSCTSILCSDSTTAADQVTCFSNTGSNLDLLAPGCKITSTVLGGDFEYDCGTSMAAPHVSGAIAVLLEANPLLTPDEILDLLQDTGVSVDSWERIDIEEALDSLDTVKTLTVSNTGDADLTVSSISGSESWISDITPTSFTLSPGDSETVIVRIDPTSYSPGSETATVTIRSNDPDDSSETVSVTMNIDEYNEGYYCSSDSDCSSNYCDSDGSGLDDDEWCFTPYNTYFDGEETTYCEYSTGRGNSQCDEREVEEDLDQCSGTLYYEDECSSACDIQDITSAFECSESGCSCAEPLCDDLTTSSEVTTCTAGETYFADQCTATASGEDRTDTICRSSLFDSSCTGDIVCEGIQAGTNNCNEFCVYSVETSASNTAPTQDTPLLTSSLGTDTTDEDLTVTTVNTNDVDGDDIQNIIAWMKDGSPYQALHMPFDTPEITDYSGNENAATTTATYTEDRNGFGAYTFTGTEEIIVTDDDTMSMIFSRNEVIVVSAWVKTADGGPIFVKDREYSLLMTNTGGFVFNSWGGTSGRIGRGYDDGNWHHVVAIFREQQGYSIYVDGSLIGEATTTDTSLNTASNLEIGGHSARGTYFVGEIDDVLLFKHDLSDEQIQALYESYSSGNPFETIVAEETTPGETWSAVITPTDGIDDGEAKESNDITIV